MTCVEGSDGKEPGSGGTGVPVLRGGNAAVPRGGPDSRQEARSYSRSAVARPLAPAGSAGCADGRGLGLRDEAVQIAER